MPAMAVIEGLTDEQVQQRQNLGQLLLDHSIIARGAYEVFVTMMQSSKEATIPGATTMKLSAPQRFRHRLKALSSSGDLISEVGTLTALVRGLGPISPEDAVRIAHSGVSGFISAYGAGLLRFNDSIQDSKAWILPYITDVLLAKEELLAPTLSLISSLVLLPSHAGSSERLLATFENHNVTTSRMCQGSSSVEEELYKLGCLDQLGRFALGGLLAAIQLAELRGYGTRVTNTFESLRSIYGRLRPVGFIGLLHTAQVGMGHILALEVQATEPSERNRAILSMPSMIRLLLWIDDRTKHLISGGRQPFQSHEKEALSETAAKLHRLMCSLRESDATMLLKIPPMTSNEWVAWEAAVPIGHDILSRQEAAYLARSMLHLPSRVAWRHTGAKRCEELAEAILLASTEHDTSVTETIPWMDIIGRGIETAPLGLLKELTVQHRLELQAGWFGALSARHVGRRGLAEAVVKISSEIGVYHLVGEREKDEGQWTLSEILHDLILPKGHWPAHVTLMFIEARDLSKMETGLPGLIYAALQDWSTLSKMVPLASQTRDLIKSIAAALDSHSSAEVHPVHLRDTFHFCLVGSYMDRSRVHTLDTLLTRADFMLPILLSALVAGKSGKRFRLRAEEVIEALSHWVRKTNGMQCVIEAAKCPNEGIHHANYAVFGQVPKSQTEFDSGRLCVALQALQPHIELLLPRHWQPGDLVPDDITQVLNTARPLYTQACRIPGGPPLQLRKLGGALGLL